MTKPATDRREQLRAIEGWALNVYQESKKDNPNLDEILENLRKISLEVRSVYFRWEGSKVVRYIGGPDVGKRSPSGGSGGTKEVAQMRAAAVVTLRDIKKDKGLSNNSKKNIRMLYSLATEVVKVWTGYDKEWKGSRRVY